MRMHHHELGPLRLVAATAKVARSYHCPKRSRGERHPTHCNHFVLPSLVLLSSLFIPWPFLPLWPVFDYESSRRGGLAASVAAGRIFEIREHRETRKPKRLIIVNHAAPRGLLTFGEQKSDSHAQMLTMTEVIG